MLTSPSNEDPHAQTYELMDVYLKELFTLQAGFAMHVASLGKKHKDTSFDSFLIDQIKT